MRTFSPTGDLRRHRESLQISSRKPRLTCRTIAGRQWFGSTRYPCRASGTTATRAIRPQGTGRSNPNSTGLAASKASRKNRAGQVARVITQQGEREAPLVGWVPWGKAPERMERYRVRTANWERPPSPCDSIRPPASAGFSGRFGGTPRRLRV